MSFYKSKYTKLLVVALFSAAFCLLNTLPASAIRIGLIENVSKAYIATSKTGVIAFKDSGRQILRLFPMQKYYLYKKGHNIIVKHNSQTYNLGSQPLLVMCESNGYVSTKQKWYRGVMEIYPVKKGLTLINNVGIESYIQGVVPSEMPPAWNFEAHKAQAIAARSYAIANFGKRKYKGYDLKDTPEDQAYGGASAETAKTNAAVKATQGQVLTYSNKIIPAYYHASSGGRTLSARRVWDKDLPFIKPVNGYDRGIKKSGHGVGMSQNGANNLAKRGYNAYQILGHYYKNVRLYTLPAGY